MRANKASPVVAVEGSLRRFLLVLCGEKDPALPADVLGWRIPALRARLALDEAGFDAVCSALEPYLESDGFIIRPKRRLLRIYFELLESGWLLSSRQDAYLFALAQRM